MSALALAGAGVAATHAGEPGLVIEALGKGSALAKAGLAPGDELLEARPEGRPRARPWRLHSPFDLAALETEEVPRGPLRLEVRRGTRTLTAVPPAGDWLIEVRPALPPPVAARYEEGRRAMEGGQPAEGARLWREAAAPLRSRGEARLESWLLLRLARTLSEARQWEPAQAALAEAAAAAAGDGDAARAVRREEGRLYERQNRLPEAEQRYAAALEDAERRAPETLALAAALHDRAEIASTRGQLDAAGPLHDRALALRRRLAPESLPLAASLAGQAKVVFAQGHAEQARTLLQEARSIQQRLAPQGLALANTLYALAIDAFYRADLAAAESLNKEALAVTEADPKESLERANALDGLGMVASQRGDQAASEDFHTRALAILERVAPGGLPAARVLNHLGNVAWFRDDVDRAEDFYKRSLAIRQALAPDSLSLAASWANLGLVARTRGQLPLADEYYQKALAIQEARAPGSWAVARALTNLGMIARSRHDLAAARDFYTRALALAERLSPGSLQVADASNALGELALTRGEDAEAERRLDQALELYQKLAPNTSSEALILYRLALLRRRSARPREALAFLERALAASEAQSERLGGGTEQRSGFAASFQDQYRTQVEVFLALGENENAFHSLERSRARGLLEMLAQRDSSLAGEVPAELQERRRQISREYDRTLGTLGRLNAARDGERIEPLLATLRDLRAQSEAVTTAIRKASPRLAEWRYPQPFDAAAARAALDPGTVLLSYSAGPEQTLLFVLSAEDLVRPGASALAVHALPVGEARLREEVDGFRALIRKPAVPLPPAFAAQAEGLFEQLIRPAEESVARARRVVICPDGPLHTLPWGALLRAARRGQPRQWLIEWKPVHVVVSATVYGELRKRRPPSGEARWARTLVAFGDPDYAAAASTADNRVPGGEDERGLKLAPLPSSRKEVEGILEIFRGAAGHAQAYLGAEATEEKVRTVGPDVRYLHLAGHAFTNAGSPLDSSLVLSLPRSPTQDQANGWLQAWEIMAEMKLDADLVTLSACDSGLGKERRGEGLVGLARAFQFAGARSVVASLWKVGDNSTAGLMQRFYHHLRAGRSKDQALRLAQLDLIHGKVPSRTAPFHWAAFQLIGDWI